MWILYILILGFPLGVAAQNLTHGVGFLASLPQCLARGKELIWPRSLLIYTVSSTAMVSLLTLSTALNSKNLFTDYGTFVAGHLAWMILPLCLFASRERLTSATLWKLGRCLTAVCVFWAVVVLSQALFGWRLSGTSFVSDLLRPRGFYSHPLTLAYAALLVWPLAVGLLLKNPKGLGLALSASTGLIIYLSESRTVQLVAGFILVWNVFTLLKGRTRFATIAALALTLLTIALTPNRISTKFSDMLTDKGVDRQSEYADDRLAFWDAHRLMIQERPLLGHGANLTSEYRSRYYEALGLGSFTKKYEAHNTFMQMWTEGGLLSLLLFLVSLSAAWQGAGALGLESRRILRQTIVALCLAALTQNAFQDSEVRAGLTLIMCSVWLLPLRRPQ